MTSEYTNEGHAERKLIFQYLSTNEHICDAVLWLHSGEKRKKQTRVKAEENKFSIQWRIQDFPTGGGGGTPEEVANRLFGIIFAENCMKMKKKLNWMKTKWTEREREGCEIRHCDFNTLIFTFQ